MGSLWGTLSKYIKNRCQIYSINTSCFWKYIQNVFDNTVLFLWRYLQWHLKNICADCIATTSQRQTVAKLYLMRSASRLYKLHKCFGKKRMISIYWYSIHAFIKDACTLHKKRELCYFTKPPLASLTYIHAYISCTNAFL